ncbi:MAG: hypothetical protein FE78DRAFT_94162 [Acidomyces sp. 'richmondensis']|nr:MAG: hypothetical protein FE78DRAFT_94162 [Acidomyces sp. 'richmondensis']
MGLSKSQRILILLLVNFIFFLLEISTGYAVHSLALVADAFHMLNDVLSLLVGLWAVKVAASKKSSKTFTYGWQRAETLGALVNGVFLVALCVTIFLDAIQRFFEPQEVSNPKLVLIVGSLGLGFNILGLFLFHDHSHSHGGGDEGHGRNDGLKNAEEGHAHSERSGERDSHVAPANGEVTDGPPKGDDGISSRPQRARTEDSESSALENGISRGAAGKAKHRKSRRYSVIDDIYVSPNAFRQAIIEAGRTPDFSSEEAEDDENDDDGKDASENVVEDDQDVSHEHESHQPLLNGGKQKPDYGATHRKSFDHSKHQHAQPKSPSKGHGHSHGDLNMRGIFLHVMGDALGNIGVIATALVIWFCKGQWRFYFDPIISLVITVIILGSAIPLCRAASRILLQGVPAGINIDDIKEDIESFPGIISCHHLHVWQLNDSKMVASLHVQVAFDFKGEGSARYMHLAQGIRKCLHEYGIHSSTIQPEFCLDPDHDHTAQTPKHGGIDQPNRDGEGPDALSPSGASSGFKFPSRNPSKAGSTCGEDTCLLACDDNCGGADIGCYDPTPSSAATASKDGDGHEHAH